MINGKGYPTTSPELGDGLILGIWIYKEGANSTKVFATNRTGCPSTCIATYDSNSFGRRQSLSMLSN